MTPSTETLLRLADTLDNATQGDFADAMDALSEVTRILQDRAKAQRVERDGDNKYHAKVDAMTDAEFVEFKAQFAGRKIA